MFGRTYMIEIVHRGINMRKKRLACPTSLGHAKSVAMINFKIDSEIDSEHTNKKIGYFII